jgi:hypothetical protein
MAASPGSQCVKPWAQPVKSRYWASTPAPDKRFAYCPSPADSTSFSAAMINAGGRPAKLEAKTCDASGFGWKQWGYRMGKGFLSSRDQAGIALIRRHARNPFRTRYLSRGRAIVTVNCGIESRGKDADFPRDG